MPPLLVECLITPSRHLFLIPFTIRCNRNYQSCRTLFARKYWDRLLTNRPKKIRVMLILRAVGLETEEWIVISILLVFTCSSPSTENHVTTSLLKPAYHLFSGCHLSGPCWSHNCRLHGIKMKPLHLKTSDSLPLEPSQRAMSSSHLDALPTVLPSLNFMLP